MLESPHGLKHRLVLELVGDLRGAQPRRRRALGVENDLDLAELVRRSIETDSSEAAASFYAPGAAWDASQWGMGVVEGKAAVRGFFEDWSTSDTDMALRAEEIVDLGNGVTFAVVLQQARLAGSGSSVQLRYGSVAEWTDGLIVRNIGETIAVCPPLIINENQIHELFDKFGRALDDTLEWTRRE